MAGTIDRLQKAVLKARDNPTSSRTARLLRAGSGKIGKEVGEEMASLVVEAMQNHRMPVVRRSADLLYNLTLLWASVGVDPKHVWNEMNRRERVAKQRGFVEKRRKVPKWPLKGDLCAVQKISRHKEGPGREAPCASFLTPCR